MEVLTLAVQPENHTRRCHLLAHLPICPQHWPRTADLSCSISSRPSRTHGLVVVDVMTSLRSSQSGSPP
jgi:hypothetical protein